ncbi:MAG TPA: class I SAM-dependent methyltransferase [Firmicutes bacterium]|nr:class I SAM-dependent methyltransferase [Bacillota bacterium]
MTDEKYWNEVYYKELENVKPDFLKDIWLENKKEIIDKVKNKNAIDLGCGLGQDTGWLLKNGFQVVSCDFSKRALKKVEEHYPSARVMELNIANGLPFQDNSIGLVNANLSLHYFTMEKTEYIFAEIYRVLEPNGLLIGRVNSDKNNYVDENCKEIETNFYYDAVKDQHKRLFNQEQFAMLKKKWNVVVLKEEETVRKGRKKYTWEFILRK